MNTQVDKKLVRRYLLGALSEDEQCALEVEYFADHEKFEQVWALENELVDEYVRGRLGHPEQTLFERNYLASPKHQERVAVARQLLQAADAAIVEERSVVITSPTSSWWSNFLAVFQTPQLAWGGAMAMLLLAAGMWWYFRAVNSVPGQIAQTSPTPIFNPTVSPAPVPPTPTASLAMSPSLSPQPTASAPLVPAVLAFALVSTGSRTPGANEIQKLTIPNNIKQVRLQMKTGDEKYPRYQVLVRNLNGVEVVRQASLLPSADKKSVAVLIASTKLSPGDYVVILSGLSQTGELEKLDQFLFRVRKK